MKPILAPSEKQPQIAITSPDTFDVFGGYNYQSLLVWPSGSLQPVDTRKIRGWNGFYKLFTHGKLNPASARCTFGDGNAPFRTTFVDPDGSTGLPPFASGPRNNRQIVRWIGENGKPIGGKPQPRFIVGPAAHFNADSMGYNADVIKKRPEQVSWAELLNAKWKGRVSLLRDPGIMSQDAAFAAQALGLMKFKDFGNPTRAEIDRLYKILTRYKKQGQFRAFWSAFTDSVNLMVSEGGRARVDVVAGRGARQGRRRQHPLRGPEGGLPRLVQRGGHLVEGHRSGEAAGLLRLHQLELQRVPRRDDHAPGLLHRQRAEAPAVDQVGSRQAGRLHPRRVRLLVGRQAGSARPARHHRQGRRHQEGRATRGRLVPAAHLQVRVLELVSARERVPRQDRERLPDRLAGAAWRIRGVETGGAANAAPPTGQPGLDLIGLTKVFPGGTVAVDDVNLHVDHGEYVVLLGPSGCGKTTTLRMIGGHEHPTQGEILLDGESLIGLPPHKRPTTTVFQHFALFPHRTTLQNVEFGLKMHGVGKAERRETSMKALEMVGLEPLADRKPSALSGGQQQRVALARVLVTKPKALLLDEPLGDLDRLLQLRMRVELRNLQRQLGLMFIHVTHNQEEALSMADRIVVMNDARIQQVADPLTIATKPATELVARFMGDNNILRGVVTAREGDRLVVENEEQHLRVSVLARDASQAVGSPAMIAIRAAAMTVEPNGSADGLNSAECEIVFVEFLGDLVKLHLLAGSERMLAKVAADHYPALRGREGERIRISWKEDDVQLLDA